MPRCVNPAHLELGTAADNTHDMISRGRKSRVSPKGESNGKARLTEEQALFIQANPTANMAELAREFGVSPGTIRGVRIGRTWAHLKDTS